MASSDVIWNIVKNNHAGLRNAPNGRQFSGERFNLSNLNTRSRSGFINRAIDIALEKRGDQAKLVVSVKKSARKHAHKVANGATVAVLRADPKANKRAVNQSVTALVTAARRHSLIPAALGRVSRLRKTLKKAKKPVKHRQPIPYVRRLALASKVRAADKKKEKRAAKLAAKAAKGKQ